MLRLNDILKTQLQHQLDGNSPESWGRVLQKAAYALSQCLIYVIISHIARIQESRNQVVEKGIVLLIITPSDPLGKFAAYSHELKFC